MSFVTLLSPPYRLREGAARINRFTRSFGPKDWLYFGDVPDFCIIFSESVHHSEYMRTGI
jgi:hypothetical protein